MQVKKEQLEPDIGQKTGSKLGNEHVKTILSPCLFNLYAESIMQNAGLDEAQAAIKIAGRNVNNLRYADAPASSVHGVLQARILEWIAMSSSRGSSGPRDPTHAS